MPEVRVVFYPAKTREDEKPTMLHAELVELLLEGECVETATKR